MKKLMNGLVLALIMMPFLATGSSVEAKNDEPSDEALRCVIRDDDGNKIIACWFCDCSEAAMWAADEIEDRRDG